MIIGMVGPIKGGILAPMAGITDLPFRMMAKEAGCGLVCAEMVSAQGLTRNSRKTFQMLAAHRDERPISIQMFGAEPAVMAEAAQIIQQAGADLIDINFGCAVKKVVKTGAGVALMKNADLAARIFSAVRKVVRIPLTVKIRTGWDKSGVQAIQIAQTAEACGLDGICVHPRTAAQGFSGVADWSVIRQVKQAVKMPVIGNGDIRSAADARRMLAETGCDAVMIGRAAIGYPWIFEQILAELEQRLVPEPDIPARCSMLQHYLELLVAYYGEKPACLMLRSRLGWFVKSLPFAAEFRNSITRISSKDEALEKIQAYRSLILDIDTA